MDHRYDLKWQIPCCDFFQRQEIVDGAGEAGGRQNQKKGKRLFTKMAPQSHMLPAGLHICPAPDETVLIGLTETGDSQKFLSLF